MFRRVSHEKNVNEGDPEKKMRRDEDKTKERSSKELQKSLQGNTDLDTFEVRLRQAEQAPLESKEGYQFLVDHIKEIVLVLNKKGKIIFANKNTLKDFGYSKEELIGKSITHFLTRGSITKALYALAQEFLGRPQPELEVQAKTKSGEIRYLSVAEGSAPIHENGKLMGVMISAGDITKLKTAEETLRKRNIQLELIHHIQSEIPINADIEDILIRAAESIGKEFGYYKISVNLYDRQTNEIEYLTGWNKTGLALPRGHRQKLGQGLIGRAGLLKQTIVANDVSREPDYIAYDLTKTKSELIIPLLVQDELIGVLDLQSTSVDSFSKENISVLQTAASYIARVIDAKQKAEALRLSEERYRSFVECSQEGIFIIDHAYRIIYANEELTHISGYSFEDVIGQDFRKYLDDESQRLAVDRYIRRQRGENVPSRYELNIVHKDGEKRKVEISSTVIENSAGNVETMCQVLDITERKRADEALQESEEKYRTLVENAAEAILIAQDGMLKFVNHAATEIIGYSEQELRFSPFLEFIHPDDRKMVGERHLRRLKGDVSLPRYTFRLINKDGRIKWVEIDAVLVTWKGKPATLNFLSDITERKRAEEALRRAEEDFRRSLDESPLGIRIVSAEGETLYANRAILDIYGYDVIEELKSTPVKNRYTPESYAEYQLRKKKRMNGEEHSSEYEISIVRKMGEIRRLRVFRKEILWNGQKQFQAIYQDITERKKAEEKLRETLGGLRNALGGIIQVLSATTEKRDPYTAGHQRRVADLARAISQKMGLAADRVEGLRVAGTIHDIGKVSIPAEILSKPSRLTKIEYNLIQSHPQVAYDILQDIDFSWPIAKMILQHHERMNGSGYPNQVMGEEILLEARILAVSDVVEAMASHRPYRPALGIEVALEEIEKNKGVLYDPDVVSACLTLFREKGFAFK